MLDLSIPLCNKAIEAVNFSSKIYVFNVQRQEGNLRCDFSTNLMTVIMRKSSSRPDASNDSFAGFGCI